MKTHNRRPTSNGPFGATFQDDHVPSIDMTPDELLRRMEQGFTVRQSSIPTPRVTGQVKRPSLAKKSTNPPRAGFGASAPGKRPPAKKAPAIKTAPVKRVAPPAKKAPLRLPAPTPKLNKETGTFTIEPVNMKQIEIEAVREKIVNIIKVPPKLRKTFLAKLKSNQEKIAEYLFLNIATFELAIPTALEMLQEYLTDSTETGVQADLGRVESMLTKISDMRTLEFLCKQVCGLSAAQTDLLVRDMFAPDERPQEDPLKNLLQALTNNKQTPQQQPKVAKQRRVESPEEAAAKQRVARTAKHILFGRG